VRKHLRVGGGGGGVLIGIHRAGWKFRGVLPRTQRGVFFQGLKIGEKLVFAVRKPAHKLVKSGFSAENQFLVDFEAFFTPLIYF